MNKLVKERQHGFSICDFKGSLKKIQKRVAELIGLRLKERRCE